MRLGPLETSFLCKTPISLDLETYIAVAKQNIDFSLFAKGYNTCLQNIIFAMATVNVVEGVRYGLDLIVYIFVIGLAAGLGLMLGFAFVSIDNILFTLIGSLLALASFLAFYAGMMGILYKVIADGVTVGMEAANESSPESETDIHRQR